MCVCMCVYLGSISSLRLIRLNITDKLCLRIFVPILSNRCIVVLISGQNWLKICPYLTSSLVSSRDHVCISKYHYMQTKIV